jgi:hypothetical protein
MNSWHVNEKTPLRVESERGHYKRVLDRASDADRNIQSLRQPGLTGKRILRRYNASRRKPMKITSYKPDEFWRDGDKPGERYRFHELEAVAAVGDFDVTGIYTSLSRFNSSAWGGVDAGHLQFINCKCDRATEDLNRWDIRITLRETTLGYNDPCQLLIDGEWKSIPQVTHHKLYGEPVDFREVIGSPPR